MAKEFDFVVFGATGFTGKYVCKELLKQVEGKNLKVAIAGRSNKKLEEILNWLIPARESGKSGVSIVIADIDDDQSLYNMCKRAKIVLDCVGPFKLYGEAVVRSCLDAGTDYVDVTGEPEYMERIAYKYHDTAVEKGVYIVSACGFDSIPSELGVIFAKKKFNGTLASIENYFTSYSGPKGFTANYGTYASMIHGISDFSSLQTVRKLAGRKSVPLCGPKLKYRSIHFDRRQNSYALPFLGADVSVVKRAQRFFFEKYNEVPTQFSMYYCTSFMRLLSILLFGVVCKVLTLTTWGKNMLLKHPKFFTAGAFSREGPTEQQMADGSFDFVMYCKGYKRKIAIEELSNETPQRDPPDCEMTVKISGPEIAYVLTPIVMVQSAFCLTNERSELPDNGGVYTAGPAFSKTSLIEKLQSQNVKFEVISQ